MIFHTQTVQPRLVVFDLFGTLVKYGVMHHPFRQLLKWARENGRQPQPDDARSLMTKNLDMAELAASLGINAPDFLIDQIQSQIQEELTSLSLYEDVLPTLGELRKHNIPAAICSNLASPYGATIDLLLDKHLLIRALSYEIGFIKPEREIYQAVIAQTLVPAEECLFVGDTLLADYEGPRLFGMQAYHLMRGTPSSGHVIHSLGDIFR